MKKHLPLFALALAAFTAGAAHAGSYTVAECVANHNRWTNDRCTRSAGGGSCSARYDGQSLAVNLGGSGLVGSVGEAYEIRFGSYARHDVNFGGLVRGMLEENAAHRARLVEVYANHDASGSSYTKYTCRL